MHSNRDELLAFVVWGRLPRPPRAELSPRRLRRLSREAPETVRPQRPVSAPVRATEPVRRPARSQRPPELDIHGYLELEFSVSEDR